MRMVLSRLTAGVALPRNLLAARALYVHCPTGS